MPIEVITPLPFMKEKYYEILIRQPDFMTVDLFLEMLQHMKMRQPRLYTSDCQQRVAFIEEKEGPCIQLAHLVHHCPQKTDQKVKKYLKLHGDHYEIKKPSYCHQIFLMT